MLRKCTAWIVRRHVWFLIAALVLATASCFTVTRTTINYDFTRYLSENTMTRRSLDMMGEEFAANGQMRFMFRDISDEEAQRVADELSAMDEVLAAVYDRYAGVREADGVVYRLVSVTLNECDTNAFMETVNERYGDTGDCVITGDSASTWKIMRNIAREIPIAMAIALGIVLAVLLLTSRSWIEPLLLVAVLLIGIVINMGTNWVFESISFVTYAVCAILQLALSMDYAIMLIHCYTDLREEGMNADAAMAEALARSFLPIASSALTTVAGLLSLLFMSFTIGFDIGIVLSKGILISVATVFIVMPALVLRFGKAVERTTHKPLPLGGQHLASADYALRKPLAAALVVLIAVSCWLQTQNVYTFTDAGTQSDSMAVEAAFGKSNQLVLLIPVCETDADYEEQLALIEQLQAIEIGGRPAVSAVASMVTTGAQALAYYDASAVAEMLGVNDVAVRLFFMTNGFGDSVRADRLIAAAAQLMPDNAEIAALSAQLAELNAAFNGESHSRLILSLDAPYSGAETYAALDDIMSALTSRYGGDYGLIGTSMSAYDISAAFDGDLLRVNLITVAMILLILLVSFRSLVVPAVLVCVIQGAIWITMAFSAVTGQPIFFVCYLICLAIQMGATIDYGILLTNHYRVCRREQPDAREALREALKRSLPTIATSGTILVFAGYTIGKVCSVYYISSIGLLIARGTAVSVALVLILLPMLLALLDRFVCRPVRARIVESGKGEKYMRNDSESEKDTGYREPNAKVTSKGSDIMSSAEAPAKEKVSSIRRVTLIGMMAAIVCVVTLFRFPLLGSKVHFANSMCLLSGLLLGPLSGGIAAGLGSALYDLLLGGYDATEAIITFVNKFAMAWVCAMVAGRLENRSVLRIVLACVAGALTYMLLYLFKTWIFQRFVFGYAHDVIWATLLSKVPASAINASLASVATPVLYAALLKPLKQLKLPWRR